MVKVKHSAQFALTFNRPVLSKLSGCQQLVSDSLMVPELIVEFRVFLDADFQVSSP